MTRSLAENTIPIDEGFACAVPSANHAYFAAEVATCSEDRFAITIERRACGEGTFAFGRPVRPSALLPGA
jgi:hypothetical protein